MERESEIHKCDLELEGFEYFPKEWLVIEQLKCKNCGARSSRTVKDVYTLESYSKNIN